MLLLDGVGVHRRFSLPVCEAGPGACEGSRGPEAVVQRGPCRTALGLVRDVEAGLLMAWRDTGMSRHSRPRRWRTGVLSWARSTT